MHQHHDHHLHLTPVPIKNRRVWRDLARILSTIFNPFITALALFIILALARATDTLNFWWLLFLSTFFTSIGPMLYIFWLYATDRISDLDMSIREERERVFGVFVIFYLLGTLTLWLTHSPSLLIAAMAGYTVATMIVQYITRYWKISTHALGITAPLVALSLLYGRQPLPFFDSDSDGLLGARLFEGAYGDAGRRRRGAGNGVGSALLLSFSRRGALSVLRAALGISPCYEHHHYRSRS